MGQDCRIYVWKRIDMEIFPPTDDNLLVNLVNQQNRKCVARNQTQQRIRSDMEREKVN